MSSMTSCDLRATYLYRLYDVAGRLLYVGVSIDPEKRVHAHRVGKMWGGAIHRTELELHDSRAQALAAERRAIATEQPLHNLLHNPNPTHLHPRTMQTAKRHGPRTVELQAELYECARSIAENQKRRDALAVDLYRNHHMTLDEVAAAAGMSAMGVSKLLKRMASAA